MALRSKSAMSKITEIVGLLKEQWGTPREAVHRGQKGGFLLACSFASEPADTLAQVPLNLPEDIREFWLTTRSATLFKDRQFGQWGIEVLDPDQALRQTSEEMAARQVDFVSSDLVLARFFGDSDLVVMACDPEQSNFGSVTIALPIDRRPDWPVVAKLLRGILGEVGGSAGGQILGGQEMTELSLTRRAFASQGS